MWIGVNSRERDGGVDRWMDGFMDGWMDGRCQGSVATPHEVQQPFCWLLINPRARGEGTWGVVGNCSLPACLQRCGEIVRLPGKSGEMAWIVLCKCSDCLINPLMAKLWQRLVVKNGFKMGIPFWSYYNTLIPSVSLVSSKVTPAGPRSWTKVFVTSFFS